MQLSSNWLTHTSHLTVRPTPLISRDCSRNFSHCWTPSQEKNIYFFLTPLLALTVLGAPVIYLISILHLFYTASYYKLLLYESYHTYYSMFLLPKILAIDTIYLCFIKLLYEWKEILVKDVYIKIYFMWSKYIYNLIL
jgi:hypothetical protein